MKILFFSWAGQILYGANRSWLDIILGLAEKWHVVQVICPYPWELSKELETRWIHVYFQRYYSCASSLYSPFLLISWIRWYLNKFLIKQIFQILRGWTPDLVYSNTTTIDIWFKIAKYMNIPHAWHIREFWWEDYSLIYFGGKHKLYKKILQSKLVIFISKSIYSEYKNCAKRNYIILKDPISDFVQKRKKININSSELHFLVPWFINKKKGQILALRAFHIFSKEHKKAQMVFLGSWKYSLFLKIYCYIFRLSNVFFLWYKKNVKPFFRKADLVLVCSRKEALWRVTLEAMMYGVPVIGNDTAGTKELISNNRGISFNGTYTDLYKKMEIAINNTDLLQKYSNNGINYINNFCIKKNYITKLEKELLWLI